MSSQLRASYTRHATNLEAPVPPNSPRTWQSRDRRGTTAGPPRERRGTGCRAVVLAPHRPRIGPEFAPNSRWHSSLLGRGPGPGHSPDPLSDLLTRLPLGPAIL